MRLLQEPRACLGSMEEQLNLAASIDPLIQQTYFWNLVPESRTSMSFQPRLETSSSRGPWPLRLRPRWAACRWTQLKLAELRILLQVPCYR